MSIMEDLTDPIILLGSRTHGWINRGMNMSHLTEEGSELETSQFTIDHSNLETAGFGLVVQGLGAFLQFLVEAGCLRHAVMMIVVLSHWLELLS